VNNVGLGIIEKMANVLEVEPAELFKTVNRGMMSALGGAARPETEMPPWPRYPTVDMLDKLIEQFEASADKRRYHDLPSFDPPIKCTPHLANRLEAAGVASLQQAARLRATQWLMVPRFGAMCLAELAMLLRQHGIRFADEGK
jgi:hypothetical protein